MGSARYDDLLAGVEWRCAAAPPGTPGEGAVPPSGLSWFPAQVPGTAAGAVRAAGRDAPADALAAFSLPDGVDWWFAADVTTDDVDGRGGLLRIAGLATVADLWWDDELVLHSENMWRAHEVPVACDGRHRLLVRISALEPRLAERRPRAPWRTSLVRSAGLRWWRTSLLGRMPALAPEAAPAGPWAPLRLQLLPDVRVVERYVRAGVTGATAMTSGRATGELTLQVRLRGPAVPGLRGATVTVTVRPAGGGSARPVTVQSTLRPAPQDVDADGTDVVLDVVVAVPDVGLWWPAGHGPQPRYGISLDLGFTVLDLGRVGFRTLEVDRAAGAFRLLVNGTELFVRGALWNPVDPVSLQASPGAVRERLELAREAGFVMLRFPGTTVYPDEDLLELCDELGLLVWQDLMVANLAPPDDPAFLAELTPEIEQLCGRMQGRPSTAVISGGSEVEQQAAMMGLGPARRALPVLEQHVPQLLGRLLPDAAYVVSSPTGGEPPIRPDTGVAHWFGVGGYLQPLSSVRGAGVRFAAECLAFSNPPEPAAVARLPGGAAGAGHLPSWKAGVPRDHGAGWDFEDVREHYVRTLLGVDPLVERRRDPERALDLGRAAVAHAMTAVMTEWRRPGSDCSGALVLSFNDTVPGAGWGLIDVDGSPKSVWFALRRVCSPVALLVTDEGLAGLDLHVLNDRREPLLADLRLWLVVDGERVGESVDERIEVPPGSATTIGVEALLGGFRDVGASYGFGPPTADAVVAVLSDEAGELARVVHLPLGLARPLERDLGLEAVVERDAEGLSLRLRTRVLAQMVAVDVPGYRPEDSWFDLPPGAEYVVRLVPVGGGSATTWPGGTVRAVNCRRPVHLSEPRPSP